MIGGLGGAPTQGGCSRAGCREAAVWRIDWRNPRIHTGERGKTWLACDEHVGYLREFLESRSFPVGVIAFEHTGDAATDASAGGRA
ncbi:hypothetical protein [Agromyces italicus]|uniref:hypothetical protein n=1 Tax=Agromyces italicus TaxID=279572 RepID=UPI0003B45942|nr:hypothetical protein [Agromyces italicus]